MGELATLGKVVAVLCIGHLVINTIIAVEDIRFAIKTGRKWEKNIDFCTISALILSVCVMVRWFG